MRKLWLTVGVLALAGAAFGAWYATRPDWTTSSRAALDEYLKGRQSQMKLYAPDAAASFRRALELDPEFVAPKIGLLDTDPDKAERERVLAELRATDPGRLNERERFLVAAVLARVDHDEARRRQLTAAYLERHPRDPWALGMTAGDAWARQDWAEAERGYRRLLEVDPNWLLARNILGYIAMAQGRFRESEDEFRTYRFAAPDQANPHDSLGELFVLLGRYDEARAELEQALAIRADFCASYQNLMRIAVLDRRPDDIDGIVGRIERHCPAEQVTEARCVGLEARAFLLGDDEAPWRDADGPCKGQLDKPDVLLHMLAVRSGRHDVAVALEEKLRERLEKPDTASEMGKQGTRTLLSFLTGERLYAEGRPAEAIPLLRESDDDANWWGAGGNGVVRLLARLLLARCLEATGDHAGAQEALARLRAVNPALAAWYGSYDPLAPAAGSPPPAALAPTGHPAAQLP